MEIGSFEGYSTIVLAKAIQSLPGAGEVYAIDPHTGIGCESDEGDWPSVGDTWSRFNENIGQAGVSDIVRGMKMKSEEAAVGWGKPIGLLFIDGSHRYEDVQKDFLLWQHHLVRGGAVVFHDMWGVGVRKLIADDILRNGEFGEFKASRCCMFCTTKLDEKRHQVLRRTIWRLTLGLRGAIERSMTLRRYLSRMLRRA